MSVLAQKGDSPNAAINPQVKELEKLLRQAKGARGRLEASWYMCLAYYAGERSRR